MIIESFMACNNGDKSILEPVLVKLERQGLMESVHRGSAIIFHSTEGILAAWGDPEKIIFPRSAMKPLQVFTALSSGLSLSNEQVAFGSASHYGEEKHLLIAKKWLSQLSLSPETHLACGHALPKKTEDLISILQEPWDKSSSKNTLAKRIYHGCSGKHCCQLAFCIHNGWDIDGYFDEHHPAQQALFHYLEELSEWPLQRIGIDGCNLPAPAMRLIDFARALAKLADPKKLSITEQKAALQIFESTTSFPFLTGGESAPNSIMTAKSNKTFFAKNGSEGVYGCILPEANCSIVLKIADGTMKAADTAIAGILTTYAKNLKINASGAYFYSNQILKNTVGKEIGKCYWTGEKFNF